MGETSSLSISFRITLNMSLSPFPPAEIVPPVVIARQDPVILSAIKTAAI
jgi:hypothetical protein